MNPFERAGHAYRARVLQLIRDEGAISRADIARRLHLSRPTASRIVDALAQDGLVIGTGRSQPTGGRRGELYSIRADGGFDLGLELGTRHVHLAIAQLDGM